MQKPWKTTIKRAPERECHDRSVIVEILQRNRIVHVAFVDDGLPYCIPMFYGLDTEGIILHGSKASRVLNLLKAGVPACLTITKEEGLVFAKNAFSHSMNYACVMTFAKAGLLATDEEKLAASEAVIEHLCPGRWQDTRHPSKSELAQTLFLRFSLDQMTCKMRQGPPNHSTEDAALPHWAGVVDLKSNLRVDRENSEDAIPHYIKTLIE